jgi:MYXO-CTERM domain-containing protein
MNRFSAEQANRIRCSVINYRPNLYTVVEAVNLPPNAAFTYDTANLSITFTDQSTDPDGTVATWDWNFGDGSTSQLQNPSHTYTTSGTFQVELVVTDDFGDEDTITQSVTVNAPPKADFDYVADGLSVTFEDKSTDPGGLVESWSWTFGDGSTSIDQDPVHDFAADGTYNVKLVISDDLGATDSKTLEITVAAPADKDGKGCSCTLGPESDGSRAPWLLLLGLAALIIPVRRRMNS